MEIYAWKFLANIFTSYHSTFDKWKVHGTIPSWALTFQSCQIGWQIKRVNPRLKASLYEMLELYPSLRISLKLVFPTHPPSEKYLKPYLISLLFELTNY